MAAHVCFRLCGWHAFQHMKRSAIKYAPHRNLSSSITAQMSTYTAGTSISSQCHLLRAFAQGAGSRLVGNCKRAPLFQRVQRGFRSRGGYRDANPPFSSSRRYGPRGGLGSPIFFTLCVCSSSFVGAMIWQYEGLRAKAEAAMKGIERSLRKAFEPYSEKQFDFREHLNSIWNNMNDGQKMVAGIIFTNFLVFLAWKNPNFHPILMRYFSCMPGNPSSSMLLSAFSHYNLWHIAANMYVLWSFANVSLDMFGKEQWLAVYLSSATISSLASMAHKVIRQLPPTPSLGASGAIMCLLGAVCVTHPDAKLSIAFIGDIYPHSFSADSALKFIVALDTVGLILGWRVFDHAAHLGGVLFGIWYATYGHQVIWGNRETVMKKWHEFRGKRSDD